MKEKLATAVKNNIKWFRSSGIMRPDDGFWGVGERIAAVSDKETRGQIDGVFNMQTILNDRTIVLEHRRADCCAETAVMFELAAQAFDHAEYREIASNIIAFMNRSGMRVTEPESPLKDLWRWAMPNYNACWTDDNSWVITCFLFLAVNGYPQLKAQGVAAAEAMYRHMDTYIKFIEDGNRDNVYEDVMAGSRLNPHWMGLVTMALSWAYSFNGNLAYHDLIKRYYALVLDGPPAHDLNSRVKDPRYKWSVSEYAYLTLTASIAAKTFNDASFKKMAQTAAGILLQKQFPTGHFASNHYEAPEGEHFADLIYTQNWATLGLQHIALLCPENTEYCKALEKSLEFLVKIQDHSDIPVFRGCWRGMFDTQANRWGGGDKYEGGQGSIYSGWTNAPISIAMLFELTGKNLFPAMS